MLGREFFLAGNAVFTVSSPELEGHRTYRIRRVYFADRHPEQVFYFADLLSGPDNENDYTYLGRVGELSGVLMQTAKTPEGIWHTSAWKALHEVLGAAWTGEELPGLEVQHAGRCGRCGRTLTTPESIERGIGPVCVEAGS